VNATFKFLIAYPLHGKYTPTWISRYPKTLYQSAFHSYIFGGGADAVYNVRASPSVVNGARNWTGWGAGLTEDDVRGFLVCAAGSGTRLCAARMVDWLKRGVVYIWYTLLFSGTSNAWKFGKFVGFNFS
jgi:hypothetical protein